MSNRITNINKATYEKGESQRGEVPWRFLDLSGEHLGVKCIAPLPCVGVNSLHKPQPAIRAT